MNDIKKLHAAMLSILLEVVRLCEENDLVYWLDFGTLLGAKRHSGFIPWDDDIDISMPREDFKTFLEVAPKKLCNIFFVQTKKNDPEFFVGETMPCKVRLNATKVVEKSEVEYDIMHKKYHKGIFIDIFPVDCSRRRYRRSFLEKLYYNILRARERANYSKNIIWRLSKIVPGRLLDLYLKMLISFSKGDFLCYGFETQLDDHMHFFHRDRIYPLSKIEFEGFVFNAPNETEEHLSKLYNNYMELPPVSERHTHIVSFEIEQ